MMRNMTASLFMTGKVVTTPAKAKEVRPFAERMITLAKSGTLAARRMVLAELKDKEVVRGLFNELAPRYAKRQGGYTRILHLAKRRVSDGAPQVLFELVESEIVNKQKKQKSEEGDLAKKEEPEIKEESSEEEETSEEVNEESSTEEETSEEVKEEADSEEKEEANSEEKA